MRVLGSRQPGDFHREAWRELLQRPRRSSAAQDYETVRVIDHLRAVGFSRYGLHGCLATMGGLGHKAPALPVTQSGRLSATSLTDYYLRGPFTHWRSAPFGRTEKSG